MEDARRLLRHETTLVLSTTGRDASAESAPLFYVLGEGWDMYWVSSTSSRHSCNIAADDRVAVAVYTSVKDWREIRGIQAEGRAADVTGTLAASAVLDRYRERFDLGPDFDALIARHHLYVFHPRWLRYVDNRRGLGWRAELEINSGAPAGDDPRGHDRR
jgi:uncharacterized protein YhbP (UPF0306 family)